MASPYTIIMQAHPAERSITLSLNGKLSEDVIPELEHSISKARVAHQRVVIDLSEVTLVDRKAVEYISDQGQDVQVVNCPIYLRRWIRQASE